MSKLRGKLKFKDRWAERARKGANDSLKFLSENIQTVPCKNGSIVCVLGTANQGSIQFIIEPKIVLDAAEAGIKFAEELKLKEPMGAFEVSERFKEAATLPVGGK